MRRSAGDAGASRQPQATIEPPLPNTNEAQIYSSDEKCHYKCGSAFGRAPGSTERALDPSQEDSIFIHTYSERCKQWAARIANTDLQILRFPGSAGNVPGIRPQSLVQASESAKEDSFKRKPSSAARQLSSTSNARSLEVSPYRFWLDSNGDSNLGSDMCSVCYTVNSMMVDSLMVDGIETGTEARTTRSTQAAGADATNDHQPSRSTSTQRASTTWHSTDGSCSSSSGDESSSAAPDVQQILSDLSGETFFGDFLKPPFIIHEGCQPAIPEITPCEQPITQSEGPTNDVIVLDVGGTFQPCVRYPVRGSSTAGLQCGSCSGTVRSILEGHNAVNSAAVNLSTETALAFVAFDGMDHTKPGDRQNKLAQLGGELAKRVAEHGFPAKYADPTGPVSTRATAVLKHRSRRYAQLRRSACMLSGAWTVATIALLGHMLNAHHPDLNGARAAVRVLASYPMQAALATFTLLGPANGILFDACNALWWRRMDVNVLVVFGAALSLAISCVAVSVPQLTWQPFFAESSILVSVVLLGRFLQDFMNIKAMTDLSTMYELLPMTARVEINDREETREVPVTGISVDHIVKVLPGDRIPIDGIVKDGRSLVDESEITGEGQSVVKVTGSHVTAGTVNISGLLRVRSTAQLQDTVIAAMIKSVEAARARMAPVQILADIVAGRFAIAVAVLAALAFIFWAFVSAHAFPDAVRKAVESPLNYAQHGSVAMEKWGSVQGGVGERCLLAAQLAACVLVVACPCALALAAPTATLVGLSIAAKRGVLIRGGDILEALTRITHVVFDTTGTLTTGAPSVRDVTVFDGAAHSIMQYKVASGKYRVPSVDSGRRSRIAGPVAETSVELGVRGSLSEDDLLSFAAGLEAWATHPIATAIVAEHSRRNLDMPDVDADSVVQVVQEAGRGVSGIVGERHVAVGSVEWVESIGAPVPMVLQAAPTSGGTRVCVAVDRQFAGHIDLDDVIRPDARAAIRALRNNGVHVIMLTGDTRSAADAIGERVGLRREHIAADVTPERKVDTIRLIQERGGRVAMVGDGASDTSALAAADVGMAMSGGVQVPGDVANVVLLKNSPCQIVDALDLSLATFAKITQNLCWALGYNLVALPVAIGFLLPAIGFVLTPSVAAAAMALSPLVVLFNSLLLKRFVPTRLAPESMSRAKAYSDYSAHVDQPLTASKKELQSGYGVYGENQVSWGSRDDSRVPSGRSARSAYRTRNPPEHRRLPVVDAAGESAYSLQALSARVPDGRSDNEIALLENGPDFDSRQHV